MARAKYRPEQIIPMLREAEVEIGKGMTVREVFRKLGVQENTYYHWRREYGGLKMDQAKRLKELEVEQPVEAGARGLDLGQADIE
ncbi:MAG: transposase [bacterium]|nr:transposase [bacterium]